MILRDNPFLFIFLIIFGLSFLIQMFYYIFYYLAPVLLRHPEFEKEFRSSDTMAHLLEHVPAYLISDENSGLWGGAVLAQQTLRKAADA